MGKRTWIKLYCDRWLEGTLRQESLELRGIWADVLALAGNSEYGDFGQIKLINDVGLSDKIIAEIFNISEEKWLFLKDKLVETKRIKVKNNNIITINKWSKYQSEYSRKKIERTKSPTPCPTTLRTQSANIDRDREVDKEKKIDKRKTLISDNYKLTQEHIDYAVSKNISNIDYVFDDFCIYHKKQGSKFVNWYAAWQTWIRKKIEFDKKNYIAKAQEPDLQAQQERDNVDKQYTPEQLRANKARLGLLLKEL